MMTDARCVVARIQKLQRHYNQEKGKYYQTFDASGYHLVTGDHYKDNQLGIVIPPGFVLPDNILDDMWLRGRLAGKKKNRVVAKQMFGKLSEAIFYGENFTDENGKFIESPAWRSHWKEGDDVTAEIGAKFNGS